MPWALTEEQDTYQEVFRGWLADAAPPAAVRGWLDAGDPAAFESRFAASGFAGVGLPEDLGGEGGGLVELALTAEELARAAAPSAAWLATVLAAPALAGRPDLVTAALGGETAALAIPAEAMPDTATPLAASPGGAVTGSVPRMLAAGTAARFVVLADPGTGPELRLVRADTAGVSVTPRHLLDRSRSVADVVLDGAASELLPADPAAVWPATAARAAVLVAADSLGAAGRMLDLAVTYSQQRYQFGVPIGSFQAVKHAAATILVRVEAARSVVYFAAASVQAGRPAGTAARGRGQGPGHRRRSSGRRQRPDPARGDRLHLGTRPAAVLQAGQARRAPVRPALHLARPYRRRPPPNPGALNPRC